MTYHMASNIF